MIWQFNFWEYPDEMKTLIQKDICTPRLIAALFTVVKHEDNLSICRWVNG